MDQLPREEIAEGRLVHGSFVISRRPVQHRGTYFRGVCVHRFRQKGKVSRLPQTDDSLRVEGPILDSL